jgi:Superfamily II DNA/RNA helicases, SNF2 family
LGGTKIEIDVNMLPLDVRNSDVISYGDSLYRKNAVTNLSFFNENLSFRGTVNDKGVYSSVVIRVNSSGEFKQYRCSCSEYNRQGRVCQHIIAVLKLMAYNKNRINEQLDSDEKVIPLFSNGIFIEKQVPAFIPITSAPNLITTQNKLNGDQINKMPGKVIEFNEKKLELTEPKSYRLNSDLDELFRSFKKINDSASGLSSAVKKPARLVPFYHINVNYNGATHWLELSTGVNKLYVVKNVVEYVNAIYNGDRINFGKGFEYDPSTVEFEPFSKRVVELLVLTCKDNRQLNNGRYSYYSNTFDNRKIEMSDSRLLEFLKILQEYDQELIVSKNYEPPIKVDFNEGNPPLDMKLDRVQGGLKLSLGFDKTALEKLDYDGRYVLYKNGIYRIPSENVGIMRSLIRYLKNSRDEKIIIPDSDASRFHSNVLPLIGSVVNVDIDEHIETLVLKEELEARVYFDRIGESTGGGISARLSFVYGEAELNPLLDHSGVTEEGRIIIRNEANEKAILDLLKLSGFEVSHGIYRLVDEDRIFEFLYEKLPSLKEIAEVYYSEDFKAMKLQGKYHISAGVKLSGDGELLDFSIMHEGIDEKELGALLIAYRLKKKYYKLKNGSYLPLDNSQAASLARIVDSLGISDDDLKKNIIQLPRYRAMYLDSLAREQTNFQIERSTHFKNLVQGITEPQDMEYEVPEMLKSTLRDYQKTGFKWLNALADYGFGGILADDMGLGKTLQVLTFLQYRKTKTPSIVIAPTSLVYNWLEEVEKFTVGITAKAIIGTASERQTQIKEASDVDLLITSYGTIKRDIELYKEIKFAFCFLDEAQHIKNPGTLNAKTVKKIRAGNYFALTGTPIENSLTELWSVFDFLMPGYLFTHSKFTRIYEVPIVRKQDPKALKELGRHIRPFIMRRMKKDVLQELPEKTESRMTCTLKESQRKIYLAYMLEAKKTFESEVNSNGFEKSQIKILSMLTRLRQICCHPATFLENYEGGSGKLELFFELLEEAIGGGHRVLAFSQFTGMLGIIKKELEQKDIGYFYLDGETPAKDRMSMVNAFNKGKNELFLISLKAGGTGLNLVGADTVIHLDPWWNPAVEDQATDRAYRIGQKNPVSVYKLVTKGTIEEKIFELQKKKKELIDSIIKPGESFLGKMTVEEVRGLFELK